MSLDFYHDEELTEKVTEDFPDEIKNGISKDDVPHVIEDILYLGSDDDYTFEEVEIKECDANSHDDVTVEYAEDDGDENPDTYSTTLSLSNGNYDTAVPIHRKFTFDGDSYVKDDSWNHNISAHLYEKV